MLLTVHLKMVNMVSFKLCISHHNKNPYLQFWASLKKPTYLGARHFNLDTSVLRNGTPKVPHEAWSFSPLKSHTLAQSRACRASHGTRTGGSAKVPVSATGSWEPASSVTLGSLGPAQVNSPTNEQLFPLFLLMSSYLELMVSFPDMLPALGQVSGLSLDTQRYLFPECCLWWDVRE